MKANLKKLSVVALIASLVFSICVGLYVVPNATKTYAAAQWTEVNSYATLTSAVYKGGNVKLTADVQLDVPPMQVQSGKTVTLDLNGYDITSSLQDGYATGDVIKHEYAITNNGTLVITNSAMEDAYINTRGIYNYGNLTVESGVVINAMDNNGGYGVDNYDNAVFNLKGGTVIASSSQDDVGETPATSGLDYDATAVNVRSGAIVNVYSGSILSNTDFTYAISSSGTLNVYGGEVKGAHGAISSYAGEVLIEDGLVECTGVVGNTDHAIYVNGGAVTVKGGKIVGDNDITASGNGLMLTSGTAKIEGGEFSNSTSDVYAYTASDVTITGGVFEDNVTAYVKGNYIFDKETGEVVASTAASTYEELSAALAQGGLVHLTANVTATGSLNVVGKEVELNLNGYTLTAKPINFNTDANVTIKGGNLDITGAVATGDAIFHIGNYSTNAKLTLQNVTMTGDGYSSAYAVFYVYNTSELNIVDCDIDLKNDNASAGGFIKAEQGVDGKVSITSSSISLYNAKIGFLDGTVVLDDVDLTIEKGANAINQSALTIKNSTVVIKDCDGRAITPTLGDIVVENSSLDLSNCTEGEIRFKKSVSLTLDATSNLNECTVYADASADEANVNGTVVNGSETNKGTVEVVNGTANVENPVWAAIVNGKDTYTTLTAALNAIGSTKGTYYVVLNGEINEDITLTQYDEVNLTLDGQGTTTFNGKIKLDGTSIGYAEMPDEYLVIKNIDFVDQVGGDIINASITNHYPHNVTIDNCTFVGTGNEDSVAVQLKHPYNVTISNCTGTGLHSLLQSRGGMPGTPLTIENVTVTNSKNGLALGTSQGTVVVKECNLDVKGYGIRMDAETYATVVNLENNAVKAYIPVVVRKATKDDYTVNVYGDKTAMTQTNGDDVWMVVGVKEYEAGVDLDTMAQASAFITVTVDDENLEAGLYNPVVMLHGEGTAEKPFLINNKKDLEYFRDQVNAGNSYDKKYIELTADIALNKQENWTPIGNNVNQFKGYFNGGEKTISNLKVEGNNNYAGLFGYILGSSMTATTIPSVQNLTLDNVFVQGGYYVGGLAGQGYTCNVTGVTVNGEVTGTRYVGGLIGHAYTYFEDCHFNGTASCTFDALGGIAGAGDGRIYNSSVVGTIEGNNWVGGLIGNGQEGTSAVNNYIKATVSTGTNYYCGIGGVAGVAGHGYASSEFKNNYFDGEVYCEGEKVNTIVMGIVNADNNESMQTTIEGNSWNTEYYPADTKVIVTADVTSGMNPGDEDFVASAKEVQDRNNNLIMLESDLQYMDAADIEDVVILPSSKVTQAQVEEVHQYVAKVGDVKYTSIQDAINNAGNGATVVILRNVNVEAQLTVNKDLTLDLNGKKLIVKGVTGVRAILLQNGCTEFTIEANEGGIVSADALSYGIIDVNTSATLTINGGYYDYDTNNGGLFKFRNYASTIVLNNVEVETNGQISGPNYSGNVLEVNGGKYYSNQTVNSNISAFYIADGATATFEGMYMENEYALGVEVYGATATVTDCEIYVNGTRNAPFLSTAVGVGGGGTLTVDGGYYYSAPMAQSDAQGQGATHGAWCLVIMNSGGTLIIEDGEFVNGNYGDADATYPRALISVGAAEQNGFDANLVINGGKFSSIGDIVFNEGYGYKKVNVEVTGGEFSAKGFVNSDVNAEFAISGGTYDFAVEDKYLAEGYQFDDNGNGTYGVSLRPVVEVKVGAGQAYATLNDAAAYVATFVNPYEVKYVIYGDTTHTCLSTKYLPDLANGADLVYIEAAQGVARPTITVNGVYYGQFSAVGAELKVAGVKFVDARNPSGEGSDPDPWEFTYLTFNCASASFSDVVFAEGVMNSVDTYYYNCTFDLPEEEVYADHYAVWIHNNGNVVIEDCLFTDMSYGAIKSTYGTYGAAGEVNLTVTGTTFVNCGHGGDHLVIHLDGANTVTATGNTLEACYDKGTGSIANVKNNAVVDADASDNVMVEGAVRNITRNQSYTTLKDAVNYANAGDNIELLEDVTISETIVITKPIFVAFNGHTVTANARKAFEVKYNNAEYPQETVFADGAIVAYERAIDTRANVNVFIDTMTLTATGSGNTQVITVGGYTNGTNVNINNTVINAGNAGYAIITFVQSNISMLDVTLNGYAGVYVKDGSEGSNISLANSQINPSVYANEQFGAIVLEDSAMVNLTNVNIANDQATAVFFNGAESATVMFDQVTVAGTVLVDYENTFVVTVANSDELVEKLVAEGYVVANGQVSGKQVAVVYDTNGEFVGNYLTLQEAITAAQDGYTVEITAAGQYTLPSFTKDLTIKGTEGVVIDVAAQVNLSGADVVFEDLTFDYYPNKNYVGLIHVNTIEYNNVTINGQVFLYGNKETFNNCTFNQDQSSAYNVWTYGAREVYFNNCDFNSAGKSVLVYNEGARGTDLTVKESTFTASQVVEGKAAIEIDSTHLNYLDGETYTINVDEATENAVSGFGSGNVSGNSLWNNKKGNDIQVTVNDEVVLDYTRVAQIGTVQYKTLKDAVAAANATAGADEIVVITNVSDEALSVTTDMTIVGLTGEEVLNNVVITMSGAAVQLTVKDVKFTGTSYVLTGATENMLTMEGVEADVDLTAAPSMNNSRKSFIALGASESAVVDLTLIGNTFLVKDNNNASPILGWAKARYVLIDNNDFGSADLSYFDPMKFLAIENNAYIQIINNDIYCKGNGINFSQNTSRNNAYSAKVENNRFYGNADYVWIEINGTTTSGGINAFVEATSDNTIITKENSQVVERAFNANDIKTYSSVAGENAPLSGYAGVDLVKENGEIVGGQLTATSNMEFLADAYQTVVENGTLIVVKKPTATFNSNFQVVVNQTTGREQVSVELKNVVARESLQVKMYSGADLIATSTYAKTSTLPREWSTLSCAIQVYGGTNPSTSWTTEWHIAPSVGYMPTTMEVWSDGVLVASATITKAAELRKYEELPHVYKAAQIGEAYYASFEAALANAQAGDTIVLLDNVTVTKAFTLNAVNVDLNQKTLYLQVRGSGILNDVVISNGTIDISGTPNVEGNTYLTVGGKWAQQATLTLDNVNLVGQDYASEWAVICVQGNEKIDNVLTIKDSTVTLNNDKGSGGGFVKDTSGNNHYATVNIENSTITLTNVDRGFTGTKLNLTKVDLTIEGGEHGINGAELTAVDSNVTVKNGIGRGLTLNKFDVQLINTTYTIENMAEGGIRFKTGNALTADATSNISTTNVYADVNGATVNGQEVTGVEGNASQVTVANGATTLVNPGYEAYTKDQINGTKKYYMTLQEALNNAEGTMVVLLKDIEITERLEIVADFTSIVSKDGNRYTITLVDNATDDRAINVNNKHLVMQYVNVVVEDTVGIYYTRGINVYGSAKVELFDCTITNYEYYTINLPSSAQGATVEMTNCEINGFAAVNVWGNNNTIKATESVLNSINETVPESGIFGTIVINEGTHTVELKDSQLVADMQSAQSAHQYAILVAEGAMADIVLDNTTVEVAQEGDPVIFWNDAVAQVKDVMYLDIKDAFAAATAGDVILLLDDVQDAGVLSLKSGVTLDGQGNRISGNTAIYMAAQGETTITNVIFKDIANANGTLSAIYAIGLSGKAVITGNVFYTVQWDAIQITPVEGAEIVITNNVFAGEAYRYVHVQSKLDVDFAVTVTGNKMYNDEETCPLDVYYFADEQKAQLGGNYIANTDNICVLQGQGENVVEVALPLMNEALTEEVKYVALIRGEYSAYLYQSLQEAFANVKPGQTVELLADVTLTEQIKVVDNAVLADVTFDGNGYTINANLDPASQSVLYFGNTSTGAWATGVTVKDVTIDGTARFGIALMGGTTSVLENVTITGDYYYGINLYGTHGATMTNCDIVTVFTNAQDAYPLTLINTKIGHLYANKSDVVEATAKVYADDASVIEELTFWGNNTSMISASAMAQVEKVNATLVAKVGDVYYTDLQAAINEGGNVEVLTNVTMTATLVIDGDVQINLNGYTVNGAEKMTGVEVKGGSVEIYNGTVIGNGNKQSQPAVKVSGGHLDLTNVVLTQTGNHYIYRALRVEYNGSATVKECTVTGTVSAVGTTTIAGGEFFNADGSTRNTLNGVGITVENGTKFNYEITVDYCAYGYKPQYENGVWTVVETNFYKDYVILDAYDFQLFANMVNEGYDFAGETVTLGADVDLASMTSWTPVGKEDSLFKGTFDGQGHTVYNLTVANGNGRGLFGYVAKATIKNFTVENATVETSGSKIAVVVGSAVSKSTIENVTVNGTVKVSGINYIAGIVGYLDGKVVGCTVDVAQGSYVKSEKTYEAGESGYGVNYTMYVAGIVGWSNTNTVIENNKVANVTLALVREDALSVAIGGVMGIAQAGAIANNNTVENVNIYAKEATMTGTVVGSNYGKAGKPTWIVNNAVNNVNVYVEGVLTTVYEAGTSNGYSADEDIESYTGYDVEWSAEGKLVAGTFNGDVTAYLADGFAVVPNADKTYTVVDPTAECEVMIGSTYYRTLEEAIAMATSGATITLVKDIQRSEVITITNKSVTISGNGQYGITFTSADAYFMAQNTRGANSHTSYTLTLNNIKVENVAQAGMIVELNNNGWAKTALKLQNATLEATNGATKLIVVKKEAALPQQTSVNAISGTNVLNAGAEGTVFHLEAWTTVNTVNGEVEATGKYVVHFAEGSEKSSVQDSGSVYTGTILVNENNVTFYNQNSSALATNNGPLVVFGKRVSGATINIKDYRTAIDLNGYEFMEGYTPNVTVYVSTNFKNELIASGKYVEGNFTAVSSYWQVTSDTEAKIGEFGYATLADAIADAAAGETITLVKDIEVEETLVINKNVTIDGANYTVKFANADAYIKVINTRGVNSHTRNVLTLKNIKLVSEVEDATLIELVVDGWASTSLSLNNVTLEATNGATKLISTKQEAKASQNIAVSTSGGNNVFDAGEEGTVFHLATRTGVSTFNANVTVEGKVAVHYAEGSNYSTVQDNGNVYTGALLVEANGVSFMCQNWSTLNANGEALIIYGEGVTGSDIDIHNNNLKVNLAQGTNFVKGYTPYNTLSVATTFKPILEAEGYTLVQVAGYWNVVAVAEVDGVKYAKLSEAFEAMEANSTLTLLKDFADLGYVYLPQGATLDGNGYTLSGNTAIHINKLGGSVINTTFANIANANGTLSAIYAIALEGKAVISGNVFDTVEWDAIQATPVEGAEVVITDNVFQGEAYRYVHVQSKLDVDFAVTVTGNKMYNDADTCALDVYYFADAQKAQLGGNYIAYLNNVCVLQGQGENVFEVAMPLMDEALENELTFQAMIKAEYEQQLFASVKDALAVAQEGEVVTLLANVQDAGSLNLKKGVTLDGNGYTLSGNTAIYINKLGGSIINTTFANIANGNGKLSAIYAIALEGKAVISDNVFDTVEWDAIQATPVEGAEVVITDNVFQGEAYRYVHVQSKLDVDFAVTVTGNKMYNDADTCALDVYYFADEQKAQLGGNYIAYLNNVCVLQGQGENVFEVAMPLMDEALENELTFEAIIKGEYEQFLFEEAEAAFAYAETLESATVELLSNVQLTDKLVVRGNVTIDLNGKVLTLPALDNYAVVIYGNLTVEGEGSVEITGMYGFGLSTSCTGGLTINGGEFNADAGNYYMIGAFNGTVTINGGIFNGAYCVVNSFAGYKAKVVITDGEFFTTDEEDESSAPLLGINYAVTGGTYSQDIPSEYCVDGYDCIKNTQKGNYTVVELSKIVEYNLSLDGIIQFNFFAELTEEVIADENAYATFTQVAEDGTVGEVVETIMVADADVVDGKYRFSIKVAAAELTINYRLQIFNGNDDAVSKTRTADVKQYANAVMAANSEDSELYQLMFAMLHYGAHAQLYFNVNTEDLAMTVDEHCTCEHIEAVTIEKVDAKLAEIKAQMKQELGTSKTRNDYNEEDGVSVYGISLLMQDVTTIRIYLTIEGYTTAEEVNEAFVFTLNDYDDSIIEHAHKAEAYGNNVFYVDVAHIVAADLDRVFTLNVYERDDNGIYEEGNFVDDKILTVNYSVIHYIDSALAHPETYDEQLRRALKGLYLYEEAANAYFA